MNLIKLSKLTGNHEYVQRFQKALRLFLGSSESNPIALSSMLSAVDLYVDLSCEIIIVTPENRKEEAAPFLNEFRKQFLPNSVLIVVEEGKELKRTGGIIPLVKGKTAEKGKTTVFVCKQGACLLPTNDIREFAASLNN